MASDDRRARARRRAWGRGPAILRFEPLEGRELLSAANPLAALASVATAALASTSTAAATSTTAAATSTTAAATSTAATATSTTATATPAAAATSTTSASTTPAQSKVSISASGTSSADSSTAPAAPTYDGSNLVESSFNTPHNLDWGDSFHVTGSVSNLGSTATPVAYDVNLYASASSTVDADSVLLGTVTVPAGVVSGDSSSFDQVVNAPAVPMTNLGAAGTYYIVPVLSAEGAVAGTTPTATSGLPQNSLVTVTPKVPPNLVGAGISITPGSVSWGDTISVTASVTDDSQGAAPPTNARIVLTPAGHAPGGSYDYQIGQVPIPPIGALQTVTATQKITLPSFAPTLLSNGSNYTVTMIQDADANASPLLPAVPSATPADTTTLTIAAPAVPTVPIAQKPLPADLTVTNVQEPSPTLFRGATFTVGATVQNNGPGDAGPFKVRFLLVTDESANAPALVLGDASLPGLAANTEQDVLQTVTLPYSTPTAFAADSATGRIVAVVDPDRAINESSTANESLAAPAVQLQVVTADGQTTVPVLPGATAATTAKGTTATTPPTPAGTTSGFTSVTVAANTVPTITTPVAATLPVASTPPPVVATPPKPGSRAARHATLVARQAEALTRIAAAAKVHTQVIGHHPHVKPAPRAHPLRVFRPASHK